MSIHHNVVLIVPKLHENIIVQWIFKKGGGVSSKNGEGSNHFLNLLKGGGGGTIWVPHPLPLDHTHTHTHTPHDQPGIQCPFRLLFTSAEVEGGSVSHYFDDVIVCNTPQDLISSVVIFPIQPIYK